MSQATWWYAAGVVTYVAGVMFWWPRMYARSWDGRYRDPHYDREKHADESATGAAAWVWPVVPALLVIAWLFDTRLTTRRALAKHSREWRMSRTKKLEQELGIRDDDG